MLSTNLSFSGKLNFLTGAIFTLILFDRTCYQTLHDSWKTTLDQDILILL